MALSQRLDLRQSQQLVMTPQLQQAIKLLQLTHIELAEYIQDEVERNPLLDMQEPSAMEGREAAPDQMDEWGDGAGILSAEAGLGDAGHDLSAGQDAPLDADYNDNVFNNDAASDRVMEDYASEQLGYNGLGSVRGSGGLPDTEGAFDNLTTEAKTLRDALHEQLSLKPLKAEDKLIATTLIGYVEDSGYLLEPLENVALSLGVEIEDVEAVLGLLQGMEPTGVFARDLKECLRLQLDEQDELDAPMIALLDHLELLGKRDLPALKKLTGLGESDLMDLVRTIQSCNPKPGLAFEPSEHVDTLIPDVFVRKNPAGMWTVELNTDALPRVLVNTRYYKELSSLGGGKQDKAYISENYSNANWLVKALDQRARTIMKVASELVRQQEAFFTFGVRHLKPLNLRTIAEAIEMHESTVSRVTTNKYIACPRGIFEMKYFFTSAIQSSDGLEAHSAESVRHRIKELIDAEDPKKILSDDKIVDILVGEGMDIARRTVAKYREAMNIASSVDRRRIKRMAL